MKRLQVYLIVLIAALIFQAVGCGRKPEQNPGTSGTIDNQTTINEETTSASTFNDRFKDIPRGSEDVEVKLIILQDRGQTAAVSLTNNSERTLITGYSFLIYEELSSGEYIIPGWATEIIVVDLAFELAPGQSQDYSLQADSFESGKQYKAKWQYSFLPPGEDGSSYYAESEAVAAP